MYAKIVRYRFTVCNTAIDITDIDDVSGGEPVVTIEEVEKNGQEDTHMVGALFFDGSNWRWLEGKGLFVGYGSEELADAIPEFLTKHGLPLVR